MALAVYCVAARVVWTKRHELQRDFMSPFNETPWKNIITTEINITTESRQNINNRTSPPYDDTTNFDGYDAYSVAVEAGLSDTQDLSKPGILQMRSLTRHAASSESNTEALLYARSAFFYFIALLIIWVSRPRRAVNDTKCLTSSIDPVQYKPRVCRGASIRLQLSAELCLFTAALVARLSECAGVHHHVAESDGGIVDGL